MQDKFLKDRSKKISICMLIPSFYPLIGGAEEQARQLAGSLKKKGVRVFIVTRKLKNTSKSELINGVRVYRTFCRFHAISFLISASSFLIRNRGEYDILHVHTMDSPAILACLLKIILKKKLVIKIRNSHFLRSSRLSLFNKYKYGLLSKYVDTFIVVNKRIKKGLLKLGVKEEKIRYIPNAVDTSFFKPATIKEKKELGSKFHLEGKQIICLIGRLIPGKRVDFSLKVFSKIKKKLPNAVFLIVGDGPEKAKLLNLSEKLGVEKNVVFAGGCSKEKVLKYLKISDVFVSSSKSEGMSNALLEAMATGKAVVASRIDGTQDLILDNYNGLLSSLDEASFSKKLFLLLKNKKIRDRLSRGARETVENKFSFGIVGREYEELYLNLLKR